MIMEVEWIKVEHGLPETGECVIVTVVEEVVMAGGITVTETKTSRVPGCCLWASHNGKRFWDLSNARTRVIAWMPYPEPYEED